MVSFLVRNQVQSAFGAEGAGVQNHNLDPNVVVAAEAGLFPRINPEQVVRSAPDLIIGPAASLADLAQRPGWQGLPAVRHGRVCRLDAQQHDLLSRPGPRVGEAARMLADCLLALPTPP